MIIDEGLEFLVLDASVGDVVHDGVIEKNAVLGNNGDVGTKIVNFHLGDVLAIDEDLTLGDVVEAIEESHDGGFAGAGGTYKSD